MEDKENGHGSEPLDLSHEFEPRQKGARRKTSEQGMQTDTGVDETQVKYHTFLYKRNVSIPRSHLEGKTTFSSGHTVYTICTEKDGKQVFVERRYSEFDWMNSHLQIMFYGFVLPKLPEKSSFYMLTGDTPNFSESRAKVLIRFLSKLLEKPEICRSELVYNFLTMDRIAYKLYQTLHFKGDVLAKEFFDTGFLSKMKDNLSSQIFGKYLALN